MKPLSHLIEQAKSGKRIDRLFSSPNIMPGCTRGNNGLIESQSLSSTLNDLEVQLFPNHQLAAKTRLEIIKILEGVLEDISQ